MRTCCEVHGLEVVGYSEGPDLCHFPKGYRFDNVKLRHCPVHGKHYLHGQGHLGCHTLIELQTYQLDKWIQYYNNEQKGE